MQPVLISKVLPMVDKTIHSEFERVNFNLKEKVSIPKLKEILQDINNTLLSKVFAYVNEDDSEQSEQESDDESDDGYTQAARVKDRKLKRLRDQDNPDNFRFWLSEQLLRQYAKTQSEFGTGLKHELVLELFDFIETEYFASALYELIKATYERCLETLFLEELMKKP